MDKYNYSSDIQLIEKLYQEFLNNPDNLEPSWRHFFEGFELARKSFPVHGAELIDAEFKVLNLIDDYRKRGHYFTQTNPVRQRRKYQPTLDISNFGLEHSDLQKTFRAGNEIGIGNATLQQIIDHLTETYCHSIGVEYMFIRKPEVTDWLRNRMESAKNRRAFSIEEKVHIYDLLVKAVGFETFVHKRFTGQKRFSLEGAEALIPALDAILEKGSRSGIREFVFGLTHRGRLNVLSNILRKPYENIFREFSGKEYDDETVLGDVKYHMGYDTEIETAGKVKIKVMLLPNPSHLETVGPMTAGLARARIDSIFDGDFASVCPVVIHGDAAIAGQGIVYETIQMSQLPAYKTGGTVHLVINNQVGFTTNYLEARSSTYCTDIAKIIHSPVFHVNGDDVEALITAIETALDYRKAFNNDVFIDILCYRKYGHNEGDEPRFTQPQLYKAIAAHPNVRDIYAAGMIENRFCERNDLIRKQETFSTMLEEAYKTANTGEEVAFTHFLQDAWSAYRYALPEDFEKTVAYPVPVEKLVELSQKIHSLPEKDFFSKSRKIVADRHVMATEGKADWALAEMLAYASLAVEKIPVRLTGQDSERGTFSHRHSSLVVENTDEKYFPLKNIGPDQADVNISNSHLSEYGVLSFEYGYSLGNPKGLTIWEAQFGDFHNVAQVIIDQYISSAEDKWAVMNGLTLFLPHGYEGQGPEHSSARIERFMVLAANNNMQIINCTTPANLFNVLRRQVHRDFRKPMILFTPKSLLRHPLCISPLDELASGIFQEVIDDCEVLPDTVSQVLLCSGKIYYDLLAWRKQNNISDTALVRLEQLYPVPETRIREILDKYNKAVRIAWVQEEPANMGAWPYFGNRLNIPGLIGICRPESGSPAEGLNQMHQLRQRKIVEKAFRKCTCNKSDIYCGMACTAQNENGNQNLATRS